MLARSLTSLSQASQGAFASFRPSETFAYLLQRGNRNVLLHLFFAFFGIFTLFMAFYHVPFRDEAQVWLFARDLDWPDLLYVTRHNGHPILWLACVKILCQLGLDFSAIMVLNWAFCVCGVWLLFYRSGLPLAARIGFASAPACLLEISFVGRDYSIALALCFLAASFYPHVRESPLRFSLVLALLASTNVYASAVFVGIGSQFLLEQAYGFGSHPFTLRPLFSKYLAANLVLALGAILLVLELAPVKFPGDPFPSVASHLDIEPSRLLDPRYALAFVPWLVLMILHKSPARPLILAGIPTFLLVAIPVAAYSAWARHYLMLAMGVVYFCWIYYDKFLLADSVLTRKWGAAGVGCVVTLLVLLAGYGTKPYLRVGYPGLNDGRNAAYAIITAGLDRPGTLLASADPFRTMSLLPYLKSIRSCYVPPAFGPSPQSFAYDAYVELLNNRLTLDEIRPTVIDLAQKSPGKTIVVIGSGEHPHWAIDYGPGYHLDLLYSTPVNFWIVDEGFQIYILRKSWNAPPN